MSSALERLLRASRPFKPFEVEIAGEKIQFLARKASALQSQELAATYNRIYGEEKDRLSTETGSKDLSVTRRLLQKQPNERLATYIVTADRTDFLSDASTMLDGQKFDDPDVIALADKLQEAKKAELALLDHEALVDESMERREHIASAIRAQQAIIFEQIMATVYNEDESRLDRDMLSEVSAADLDRIWQAADGVLKEPGGDPLTSAAPRQSDEHSS